MMPRLHTLAQSLGMDPSDPAQQRAMENFAESEALLRGLVAKRKSSGLTQEQFAELLGVSQSAVARIEAGDRDPRLSTLVRYALGLDVVISHLIDGVPVTGRSTEPAALQAMLQELVADVRRSAGSAVPDNVISIDDYRGARIPTHRGTLQIAEM